MGKVVTPLLLDTPLKVSVLTRPESKSTFDPRVNVIKASYEPEALRKAFAGHDAVLALVGSFQIKTQLDIIDAAVDAGVKWFVPSDFGSRTNSDEVVKMVPFFAGKVEIADHLRSKEASGLSWTAFISGPFLDFCLEYGVFGIDVVKREATLWSGGETKFTTCSLPTVGRAVANLLTNPDALAKSKNRYVAIQSILTTQKEIIAGLEKITGDKFKIVGEVDAVKAGEEAREAAKSGDHSVFLKMLTAMIFDPSEVGNHEKAPGLDNELLLPGHQEPLEQMLRETLKGMGQ